MSFEILLFDLDIKVQETISKHLIKTIFSEIVNDMVQFIAYEQLQLFRTNQETLNHEVNFHKFEFNFKKINNTYVFKFQSIKLIYFLNILKFNDLIKNNLTFK